MQFFDKVPDVRRGMSFPRPYSQMFPPGLPVGREYVNLSKNPAPEAVIWLSAPILLRVGGCLPQGSKPLTRA